VAFVDDDNWVAPDWGYGPRRASATAVWERRAEFGNLRAKYLRGMVRDFHSSYAIFTERDRKRPNNLLAIFRGLDCSQDRMDRVGQKRVRFQLRGARMKGSGVAKTLNQRLRLV
jgi:hypothetical protein